MKQNRILRLNLPLPLTREALHVPRVSEKTEFLFVWGEEAGAVDEGRALFPKLGPILYDGFLCITRGTLI